MASSNSLETKESYYRYDIIKNVWTAYLKRKCSFEKYTTASTYFGNYVVRHRTSQFYIMKIFDGTRHVVVNREQYEKIRGELGAKTKATLPDINPYDSTDSRNAVERQRSFTTQNQLNNQMEELEDDNSKIYQRAQYEKIREELVAKTSATFPDINAIDVNDPQNVIERQKYFTSQQQFNKQQFNSQLEELESENSRVHQRAREEAADHKTEMRKFLDEKKDAKFLCFDLEVHDQDRKTMLEVGYVKFTLKQGDNPEYFHAIVNEDLHNREGFDNKEKFKFGTTVRMPLKEAAEELKKAVAGSDALLTHSGYNDKQYLAENGIDIEDKPMFDTQKLALNLLYNSKIKCWGLKRMMDEMGIHYEEGILHNAGNDAHYTMVAFKALVKRAMPTTHF